MSDLIGASPGDDHHVDGVGQGGAQVAKALAYESLDAVPDDGVADLGADGHAKTRLGHLTSAPQDDEMRGLTAGTRALDGQELPPPPQSDGPGKGA